MVPPGKHHTSISIDRRRGILENNIMLSGSAGRRIRDDLQHSSAQLKQQQQQQQQHELNDVMQ